MIHFNIYYFNLFFFFMKIENGMKKRKNNISFKKTTNNLSLIVLGKIILVLFELYSIQKLSFTLKKNLK